MLFLVNVILATNSLGLSHLCLVVGYSWIIRVNIHHKVIIIEGVLNNNNVYCLKQLQQYFIFIFLLLSYIPKGAFLMIHYLKYCILLKK